MGPDRHRGNAQVGVGSAYAYTIHDSRGDLLDGARTYCLLVDPDVPAKNFWAVDVYDAQIRRPDSVPAPGALDHLAALASNSGTLKANDDGSHDLYFGPIAPEGKETNWVETIPGKSWFQLFRIYGPLQPWFDQTWRLNEFEPVDRHSQALTHIGMEGGQCLPRPPGTDLGLRDCPVTSRVRQAVPTPIYDAVVDSLGFDPDRPVPLLDTNTVVADLMAQVDRPRE
jgi:hypothetical protein